MASSGESLGGAFLAKGEAGAGGWVGLDVAAVPEDGFSTYKRPSVYRLT